MGTEKHKKIASRNFFAFPNAYYPKTYLINLSTLLMLTDHMENCLKIKKTPGNSKELFLPENDFQNSSMKNFPKKMSKFWRLGNQPKT